ncbi:hypothetical protein WJX73_007730 [Symbiochloris irregularis]|uniref:NADP-dependent oxidoreductase domain-containing protein n=1 Tax=Symbiochloris irregularis TaxID=706552 RepID=A0AAW1NRN4_9CHLO
MSSGSSKMIYRRLGSSGLKVSVLSYGSWVTFKTQVDVPQAAKLMKQCLDAGVNFFDNAEVYAAGQSEIVMGQAIKELKVKRSDLVISTKLFWGGEGPNNTGLSRKHIYEGIKASLQRLELDYVDLVFAHRADPNTPIEETVRAFNWVIDQGLALYWGTSEWSALEIQEAHAVAQRLNLVGPTMEQPEYNLFERTKIEKDFRPLFKQYGLGTTIWSPLASGLLSGKYSKDHVPPGSRFSLEKYKASGERKLVEENLSKVDQLKKVAERLGASVAQLSLAWCAHNEDVSTVIMGATSEKQLAENLGALDVLPKLTPEVVEEIEKIFKNKP